MGPADRLGSGFRQAEVLHLAGRDQLLHRAGDVLDRHLRIDAVLVEEVDAVGAQPLQRGLGHLLDVFGPAVQATLGAGLGIEVEAELAGDDHLVAHRLQRFADQPLVGERAIDLGGVEEGDATLGRGADQLQALPRFDRRAEAKAEAHAAEAEGGDLEAATAQFADLHGVLLSLSARDRRTRDADHRPWGSERLAVPARKDL